MVPLCIPDENAIPLIAPLKSTNLEARKDCKILLPMVFKFDTSRPTRIRTAVWRDETHSLLRANLVDMETLFRPDFEAVLFDVEIHVESRSFLVSGYYDKRQPYNKALKKLDLKWRGEVAIFPIHLKHVPTFIVGTHIPQNAFKHAVTRYCNYFLEHWRFGSQEKTHRHKLFC
ncbi:hypothetical protein K435DRAFT_805617 [Dendrothele bispora CBS 962.96]|uniref:Uncharacterized protein n=1 Tax=Dendrothele bispora (strain CBS 962.96) TaxID=1314807 RepID=A0A4S8LAL9_DENBC|nr:hypothetical protein K435DRAFT_805617 [Dendrothele bispora CBS 962.96]